MGISNDLIKLRSLCEHEKGYKHFPVQQHRIDCFGFVLLSKGSGKLLIDEICYQLSANMIIPLIKGQSHQFQYTEPAEGYIVLFQEALFQQHTNDSKWLLHLHFFDRYSVPILLQLSEYHCDEVLKMYHLLKSEVKKTNEFGSLEIISNLLKAMLFKLERIKRSNGIIQKEENYDYSIFIDFRNKLEQHFKKTRSVKTYAEAVFVSEGRLNQIVREYTGKRAKQVIDERIVLEIKKMLLHSNFTIRQISSELNFSDPTNLIKFFKRITEMTPLAFKALQNKKSFFYHNL